MFDQKIVVLGTGGTISGSAKRADDNIGYTAGALGVEQLLTGLPVLSGLSVLTEQVAQIDSKDMDQQTWQRLLSRTAHWLAQPEVAGVMITHGTDTLEETAWFLQLGLAASGLLTKPVVLTCAMRPASALVPDGPQNLLDAFAVTRTLAAMASPRDVPCLAVVAVCAGKVHAAMDVQKQHPYRMDAFTSGDAGPLAYVEEGAVRWLRSYAFDWPSTRVRWTRFSHARIAASPVWPRVALLLSHAVGDSHVIDLMLEYRAHDSKGGLQGLVLATTGNGTVHHALSTAAQRAVLAGVHVVRASRCPEGRILPQMNDATPDSEGLSPVKARIALQLELLHQQI